MIRGNETITIKRSNDTGNVDDYGNPIITTQNIVIKNCLIGFGSTDEPIDVNRNPADIQLTLYLPAGTQILTGDIFIIRNTEFIKDGIAQEWFTPFGNLETGVVVGVRKRNG